MWQLPLPGTNRPVCKLACDFPVPRSGLFTELRLNLRHYLCARGGAAAVEFGLIAPVLAVMMLGVSQVSAIVSESSAMETASRAAIQYVLNGGSDMSLADTAGLQAWYNKPADATLAASEFCTCDGTTASCTQTCPDGSVPQLYVTVISTGDLGGTVFSLNRTQTQTVRVR